MEISNYSPFQVITVPFPFTDKAQSKKRPAVILSHLNFGQQAGHSVMAMITSAKNSAWPLDIPISDLTTAGLPSPSIVRMKLFTLDHRFILNSLGFLSENDKHQVMQALKDLLHFH
jgi:mRNA interferase MazF